MTATDHFLTPPIIAEALDELGGVGLDPCSNPWSLIKAKMTIFEPSEVEVWKAAYGTLPQLPDHIIWTDGLKLKWSGHGLVFVNQPYSKPEPWARKGALEGDEVIMLVQADTSTAMWHDALFRMYNSLLFWRGRLTHYEPSNGEAVPAKGPARFASALAYRGPNVELFEDVFAGCGEFIS